MQGKSDPDVELLDAYALYRDLIPKNSRARLLSDQRELFSDEIDNRFAATSRFDVGAVRAMMRARVRSIQ